MSNKTTRYQYRRRRFSVVLLFLLVVFLTLAVQSSRSQYADPKEPVSTEVLAERINSGDYTLATQALGQLTVQAEADSSGYSRDEFSSGWARVDGCDMRNRILQRDLTQIELADDNCTVLEGLLEQDMFSGKRIPFKRGPETSRAIHIEHIVAVSDAWRKGAQELTAEERHAFYNDPLNLLAVDGPTNVEKGDKDAGSWMPRQAYRCRYVARQIAIKLRYSLWLSPTEHQSMKRELTTCPMQVLPVQQDVSYVFRVLT